MWKYIDEGELRFSIADEFRHMKNGNNKIADSHEGCLYYFAVNVCIAPMSSDNMDDIDHENVKEIEGEFPIRITNPTIQHIPIHCLYCYNDSPMNALVKLENYDQLVSGLDDYDTAVIIYKPLEYIDKLKSKFQIYADHVEYVNTTPSETEVNDMIRYLYYKRKEFAEQKEFRISLPTEQIEKPENYNFGSLLDVAYCVPLKAFKNGLIIAENQDEFQRIKNSFENRGMKIKEERMFYDVRKG